MVEVSSTFKMDKIPSSMRAIVLSHYCTPDSYSIATIAVPQIINPSELLIRVHAASVNPVDVKMANGRMKMLYNAPFPYIPGFDVAGTVVAIGSAVQSLKVGDEVYSRVPHNYRGTLAEYVLSTDSSTALKPASLSFPLAASLPLACTTALQALERGSAQLSSLKGKTVYVPAGLSGTGSLAVQLAKNVFGAGRVITTLSTSKMDIIGDKLGKDVCDQCIDYTKQNVGATIGKETVDFMFDTQAGAFGSLAFMKRGGSVVSVSALPGGTMTKECGMAPDVPFLPRKILDGLYWVFGSWLRAWWGVQYSYLVMRENSRDLDRISGWVEEGKLKPVVGSIARLSDVEAIRKGCSQLFEGKGGVGKFVIEID